MQRKDVQTNVIYAVDRHGQEPNCVRVIDAETRVRRSGYVKGHPMYSKSQSTSPNSGYAIVVIDPSVKGARERALELTLRDFFEATSEHIAEGLRLGYTKSFLKYVGQYDQIMHERKQAAEEAAKRKAEAEQLAAAQWNVQAHLRRMFKELGMEFATHGSDEVTGVPGVVGVAGIAFDLDDALKLMAYAQAGKRLYDAVSTSKDGVPHVEPGRGDELAYDAFNAINTTLNPF